MRWWCVWVQMRFGLGFRVLRIKMGGTDGSLRVLPGLPGVAVVVVEAVDANEV